MFTFAHLSDPHLAIVLPPRLASLMSKRALGYLSWRTRRKALHQPRILAALIAAIKQAETDHIAITGDLINISLPAEFAAARTWLESLGTGDRITLVPGNHDAYVRVPWSASLGLWSPYMRGDDAPLDSAEDFPIVRVREPAALLGLSSARPSAPHLATGALGRRQLENLEERLRALEQRGLFRIVLIHHPPVAGTVHRRAALVDGEAFAATIRRAGAELIVHGHMHRYSQRSLPTPKGEVPVIGVASASAGLMQAEVEPAQFHIYTVKHEGDRWRLHLAVHRLDADQLAFRCERRLSLTIPA